MRKLLNFSTILFSYVLISLLVISCGGGTGGSSVGDATNGNGGNGGDATDGTGDGNPPQVEISEECLLESRPDAATFVALLCYDGQVIAEIAKAATEPQQINFLIPSTERTEGNTSRTWDISTGAQIQISHVKDYTPTLDSAADGSIKMITATEPVDAAYLFQRLTINSNSFIDTEDQLRSIGITFSPVSGSPINVAISPKLAVKSQDDFISMGKFTAPPLGELNHPLSYALANDLDLVAPGEEGAKFNDSIIPLTDASFDFDGGDNTITLRSEIDTTAADKPAGIIGKVTKGLKLENVTFNINAPISGTRNVGTIIGHTEELIQALLNSITVNINRNITLYKSADNADGYVGGLAGSGIIGAYGVVIKTSDGAVIQVFVQNNAEPSFASAVGGLIGNINSYMVSTLYNVVDVTLGVETSGVGFAGHDVSLGGLTGLSYGSLYRSNGNVVKLAISRGNMPADFAFNEVGGLSANAEAVRSVSLNLVYADFSNLGKVKVLGGLFGKMESQGADIAGNMLFISDVFTGSDVQESFGAAIANIVSGSSTAKFNDNFVSSPVTEYNNAQLASLVHTSDADIDFDSIILDNKTDTVMFKDGTFLDTLKGKVASAVKLLTLSEFNIDSITNLEPDYWEKVSGSYPQLKAPTDLSAANKAYWDTINGLIQTKLAARASQ